MGYELGLKDTEGNKLIRFVDENYKTQFYLEDGKNLEILLNNSESVIYPCKYIDSSHFEINNATYHIHEFALDNAASGRNCRPEEYITNLNMYETVNLTVNEIAFPYAKIIDRMDYNKSCGYGFAFHPGMPEDKQVNHVFFDENKMFRSQFMSVYEAMSIMEKAESGINPHDIRLFHQILDETVWNKQFQALDAKDIEKAGVLINEILDLATDVVNLAKEMDPYEYMDNYETESDLFCDVVKDITNGNVSSLIEWYQPFVDEEYEESREVQNIIDRLSVFLPETTNHKSLEAIIQNAEKKSETSNKEQRQERFEKLKSVLFNHGIDAIEDFLGYEINPEEDKDVTDKRMDLAYDEMSVSELESFFHKYMNYTELDRS